MRGELRPELTPREREVAILVAKGLTTHTIAARLSLSHHTVEAHIAHAAERLGHEAHDGTDRRMVVGRWGLRQEANS